MMTKQLKIWKNDFLRYYNRTSVIMRIVIGAAVSFGIAFLLINKIIKPQNEELKKLKQKFDSMEIIEDVDIQAADLKNKQRKSAMQLEGLKKINTDLADKIGNLSKNEIGKNILDLRFLIDSSHLRIVSEERILPKKNMKRRNPGKNKRDTHIKIKFPASMNCESYSFRVLGSYRDLRQFFMTARTADSLFFINNICIGQSKELLTDKNLNQYRALACSFEVHVPFHSEPKKTGGKK